MRALFALALLLPLAAGADDMAFDHAAVKKDCGVVDLPEGPAVGMAEKRMLACTWLGRAGTLQVVNTTEVVGAVIKQYAGSMGGIKYVYTRNGVVTGVQR